MLVSPPPPHCLCPARVLRGPHLERAVSEAKKPSSHGPSGSQCQQQQ